jgi:hypothetical protein
MGRRVVGFFLLISTNAPRAVIHVPDAGRGVPQSLEEAYLWHSLAKNGERVEEIGRRLNRSQRAAAEDRVRAHAGLSIQQ